MLLYARHLRNTHRYLRSHRRLPNYANPRLFSEKIQWRKIFDRNPLFPCFVDKVAVRSFVEKRAPAVRFPRFLWIGAEPDAIPFASFPSRFVVKPSHRSGDVLLIRKPGELDREKIVSYCQRWLKRGYGRGNREWAYGYAKRNIIVEEMIETSSNPSRSLEYRLHVFDGVVQAIQVTAARCDGMEPRLTGIGFFFDRSWSRLPYINVFDGDREFGAPPRPPRLADLIMAAEALGVGVDYIRVDLYAFGDEIYFGEITIYPNSGFGTVSIDTEIAEPTIKPFDLDFGEKWALPAADFRTHFSRGLLDHD